MSEGARKCEDNCQHFGAGVCDLIEVFKAHGSKESFNEAVKDFNPGDIFLMHTAWKMRLADLCPFFRTVSVE